MLLGKLGTFKLLNAVCNSFSQHFHISQPFAAPDTVAFTDVAGTIPAGVPINILGRSSYPLRNDNITNLAYVGSGDGSTPPEQYMAYHPGNLASTMAIKPGNTTVLLNLLTGFYCRLVPVPSVRLPALYTRRQACPRRVPTTTAAHKGLHLSLCDLWSRCRPAHCWHGQRADIQRQWPELPGHTIGAEPWLSNTGSQQRRRVHGA